MSKKLGIAIGLLVVLAITSAYAEDKATDTAAPVAAPAVAAEVPLPVEKQGVEQIVQNVCAACHAANGNSVITLNPKLAGQHPEYLLKQLKNFKEGTRANAVMSGMVANLTPEDMQNLAQYFAKQTITLGKAKSNGKGSLGEKIYRGGIAATQVPACASCHGANGAGLPKQYPRLASQHADYTYQQLKTFRTGERANAPMMTAIATKMTEAEMQAVSDYMQGLR
jgi:cytochrome c553